MMGTNGRHVERSPRRQPAAVRCAVYTRKSTEEGLQQEFNSLDAQREAAQSYIASMKHEGWICLEKRYDDGGYTGGNMQRPALLDLMADIERGEIDCVVVYKVDRLSRSLLDFARMMETFEKRDVSFVSVTQQFNTTHSMGRLTLNILLSFAQFEREIISERTRDKMSAARRKGKWVGGTPILGYDVVGTKLVVNEAEAARVRRIFDIYRKHQALLPAVRELERLDWTTKRWTTRRGISRGGLRFTKARLCRLLTHVAYVGKVRFQGAVYEGEQRGIVTVEVFDAVQQLLACHGRNGRQQRPRSSEALLSGLLICKACGRAMTPTYSQRRARRYRYYVCTRAQKEGWTMCPSPSVPAGPMEAFVIDQIRSLGSERQAGFERSWNTLSSSEQHRLIRQLTQVVVYDGQTGQVAITVDDEEMGKLAQRSAGATETRKGVRCVSN
ncbi:MAG TPA: recombinase family protein [Planctomycetaceae bacterium]|nr:recombinase family protein [Planctomycetaceae bacterium]